MNWKVRMKKNNNIFKRAKHKLSREIVVKKKKIYQLFKSYPKQKNILMITGCSRSGTTLMHRIFENDMNTKSYGEVSRLTFPEPEKRFRLLPEEMMQQEIEKEKSSFVVIKFTTELQNAMKLLNYFNDSKLVFMFRYYKDSIASHIFQFGRDNGIKNIRPIYEDDPNDWKSEGASDDVKKLVKKHFSEDMNPYDAAAIFWIARNRLFYELEMDKDPRIKMCRYEDLIESPKDVIESLYRFSNQTFPGEKIFSEIHPKALGRGKGVEFNPEIEQLASEMMQKLEHTYAISCNRVN